MDLRITSNRLQRWFWSPYYAEAAIGGKLDTNSKLYVSRMLILSLPLPLNLEPPPGSQYFTITKVESLVEFYGQLLNSRTQAVVATSLVLALVAINGGYLYFAGFHVISVISWILALAGGFIFWSMVPRSMRQLVIAFQKCCEPK